MRKGKYCVYTHSLNDIVFYVGMGVTNHRPKKLGNRTKRWKDFVKNNTKNVKIDIVKTFDNREDALKLEKELIIHYKNLGQAQTNVFIGTSNPNELNGMYGKGHLVSGEKNHFYGKTHTNEIKERISKHAKERFKNKENHPRYGKHWDEETKNTLSLKNSKYVIKVTNLETKEETIFNSAVKAAKFIGASKSFVCRYAKIREVGEIHGFRIERIN